MAAMMGVAVALPISPIDRLTQKAGGIVRLSGDAWSDCGRGPSPSLPHRKAHHMTRPVSIASPRLPCTHIIICPGKHMHLAVQEKICVRCVHLTLRCIVFVAGNGATELAIKNVTMSPFPVQVGKDFTLTLDTVNSEPLPPSPLPHTSARPLMVCLQPTRRSLEELSRLRSTLWACPCIRKQTTCAPSTHAPSRNAPTVYPSYFPLPVPVVISVLPAALLGDSCHMLKTDGRRFCPPTIDACPDTL